MNISTQPRASIIVPGQNAGEYIADLMTSLIKQVDDPGELEIVVISDGSLDDTAAIASLFCDRLPNLNVIENKQPVGLAGARNQGVAMTSAPYVVFAEANDWLAPRRLAHLMDAMDALKTDFLRTDHTVVRGRHRELVRAPQARRGVLLDPRDSILPVGYSTMVDYPHSWAGIFDRTLGKDGLLTFPEGLNIGEEQPWIWDLFLRAQSYAAINTPTICRRSGVPRTMGEKFDYRPLDLVMSAWQTFEIVQADRDATRFLPQLTRSTLALIADLISQGGDMTSDAYRELKVGAQELFMSVPQNVLAQEVHQVSLMQWGLLHDLLPADLPVDQTSLVLQEMCS